MDLNTLQHKAEQTHSSALWIWQDGQPVVEWEADPQAQPYHIMSITKSVVALLMGRAMADHRLTPTTLVADFFPEWRQGHKQHITIGMLMNHTSGLHAPDDSQDLYAAPDCVQLALCADMDAAPGMNFKYANKPTCLLPEIIKRVTGLDMEDYGRKHLFEPLGIQHYTWGRDEVGHIKGYAGLHMTSADVMRVGQLVLEGGRGLIPADWIAQLAVPSQHLNPKVSWLWWLNTRMGVPAVSALGKWGQYLVVIPQYRVVALRRSRGGSDTQEWKGFIQDIVEFCSRILI